MPRRQSTLVAIGFAAGLALVLPGLRAQDEALHRLEHVCGTPLHKLFHILAAFFVVRGAYRSDSSTRRRTKSVVWKNTPIGNQR